MEDEQASAGLPTPPPRLNEYPLGTVVAIVDQMDAARAAAAALVGHTAGQPYVIDSGDILREDLAMEADQGFLTKLYLSLAASVSDQGSLQDRYVAQARLGHHMVVATATDDAEIDTAWTILRSMGAHDGTYYGRLTVRELRT